jgi:hypothetical protein
MVDQKNQQVHSLTHMPAHTGVNRTSHAAGPQMFVNVKTVTDLAGYEINGYFFIVLLESLQLRPDTTSYLQRLEEERKVRQQGATQDNRSFLQKYWMYFVPVILFVVS